MSRLNQHFLLSYQRRLVSSAARLRCENFLKKLDASLRWHDSDEDKVKA